jgi:5-methylcytosine-specific restriction endonuclease McrA
MAGHSVYAGASLRALTDDVLLLRLGALVAQERESTADVIEHLMEVDRRESAIDLAYPSLYVYCVKKLGYSEQAAYSRIRAARAATSFPDILQRLRAGSLNLESIVRLCPYLDQDNNRSLLDLASGASKREVLSLVAQLQTEPAPQRDLVVPVRAEVPSPDAVSVDPADPGASDSKPGGAASLPTEIIPAPQHRFHFTADAELLAMVERLKGFLRHKIPDGRLESIFKEAAGSLLDRLERERRVLPARTSPTAAAQNPQDGRRGSRIVPKRVKREVWTRDEGRCAYQAPDGRRCESRDALEYDHIIAWADGGRSDTADNIRLLCRAHNQRLGRRRFGPRRR